MANYPQLSEEEIKALQLQRRRNTIMLALIGLILLVLLAIFSPFPAAWLLVLGIIGVIVGLLFVRRYLERKAMARRALLAKSPPGIEEEE